MRDTQKRADRQALTREIGSKLGLAPAALATHRKVPRLRRLPARVRVPRKLPPWRARLWNAKRLATRDLVQWLVDFAQASDGPNVSHDEIERFAIAVTGSPFISRGFAPAAELQAHVARVVKLVTRGEPWILDSQTLHPFVTHVRLGTVSYAGRPQDVFLLALRDLLSRPEARVLRSCAGPRCAKLFLKRKRGIYCSPRCGQNAKLERLHREPLEERYRRRHAAYTRAVEREKGKDIARHVQPRGPRRGLPRSSS